LLPQACPCTVKKDYGDIHSRCSSQNERCCSCQGADDGIRCWRPVQRNTVVILTCRHWVRSRLIFGAEFQAHGRRPKALPAQSLAGVDGTSNTVQSFGAIPVISAAQHPSTSTRTPDSARDFCLLPPCKLALHPRCLPKTLVISNKCNGMMSDVLYDSCQKYLLLHFTSVWCCR